MVAVLEMRAGPFLGPDRPEHGMHPCRAWGGRCLPRKRFTSRGALRWHRPCPRNAGAGVPPPAAGFETRRRGPVVVQKRLEPFALRLGKGAFRLGLAGGESNAQARCSTICCAVILPQGRGIVPKHARASKSRCRRNPPEDRGR